MATTLTNTTFETTYKDDYKDSDNYHRILFNSGKALQARELTQLQTIIQNEIRRFGSNIFVDGGVVKPGGLTINNTFEFIKLQAQQLPTNHNDIIGKVFTVKSPDPAIEVKILKVVAATGSDPDTLYVEYVSTSAGTSSATPIRVANGVTLENTTLGSSYDMDVATTAATGQGTEVSVAKGDFFVQGHFVFCEKQSIFAEKYSATADGEIGLLVKEEVVTVTDTNDLYDNQGAAPNLAAPGADRYRISLTLTMRDDIQATDNFVYLAKIQNGKLVDEVRKDNAYNVINDVLALRTKEESGNYIVKPFNANFNSLNDSNLQLEVSDGIVYIDGYRLEAENKDITVSKAQDTITINNETIVTQFGNYVLGKASTGKGLPGIDTYDKIYLRDAVTYGGNTIGSARCRFIEEDNSGDNRFYLFDITMNPGKNFNSTRSFGKSSNDYIDVVLEGGSAVLKNTGQNDLLMPLPRTRPTNTGITYDTITFLKRYTMTTNSSGNTTAAVASGSGLTFTNLTSWVVAPTDGTVDTSVNITLDATQENFSVTDGSGAASKTYEVMAYVTKSSPAKRTKTLNTTNITRAWPGDMESDGSLAGIEFLSLDKPDIYQVEAIKIDDSDGADISTNFTIDNGQRDNFYGIGRIVKKTGTTIPTGDIYVKYKYFSHSTNGDFFDVTSYPTGTVPYNKVPSHTQNDGTVVSLRDVVDFRPVAAKKADGTSWSEYTFDSNGLGGTSIIQSLPQPTDTFTADIVYYMPRKDMLVATYLNQRGQKLPKGQVKVIKGVSALDPQPPQIPTGSMPLYNLNLNPFTLHESDLSTSFIPAKRFTMADIAELEQRIDNLQELTTLSLLEVDTSNLTVLDSAGNERTKAGFLVDNFKDYAFADITNNNYKASINELEGLLEPQSVDNNTRLIYDASDAASTTTLKGDNLYLNIDSDVTHINQVLATETENINPFAVITSKGHMELSPTSDEWVETRYAPDNIVQGEDIINTTALRRVRRGGLNAFRNNWIGRPRGDRVLVRGRVDTRREQIGDRIIDVQMIPFMRARKIFFRVNGLRRDTKHFLFFGGTDISGFARSESTFERFATRQDHAGNIFTNHTAHPNGSSDLLSDSTGELIGSFIIPSNSTTKFRTGRQRVQVMDITSGIEDDALSSANTIFEATGILNTRQRTIRHTRVEERFTVQQDQPEDNDPPDFPRGPGDPLAQTFFVNGTENPNGMFITKVDVFFSTKEASGGVPVSMEIRAVENGIPVNVPMPGAVKFLTPAQVNIPSNLNSMSTIRSTPTTFEFDEPVYLEANREYAVVLKAESTEYNVFVAKTYDFLVGSTEQRVRKQPTLGSMFTSQNGFTWTPDQDRDLMFKLYRAQFATSGSAVLNNSNVAKQLLENNPLQTDSDDPDRLRVYHPGHGFAKNDYVTISGLDSSTTYAGVIGTDIMGSRQITHVDHTGYTVNMDSNANAVIRMGGDGVIATQNAMYNQFVPQIQILQPDDTTISGKIKRAEGSSFGDQRNTVFTHGGKETSFTNITLNEFNLTDGPKVIYSDSNETANISGAKSMTLQLDLSTIDDRVSPVVDLQRCSVATFEHVIDSGGSGAITVVDESDPTEGSAASKHITRAVTLDEPAVGLKILFAANRPAAAGFEVYYKIATSDENLDDVAYVEVSEETNNPADESRDKFRQYEYLAGGQVGNLSAFTQFKVKIVMTSTNMAKIPSIKDLRVIALVT